MKVPTIIRSGDLRAENRHRVLEALRASGGGSRLALGEATGLSQAAISSFAADLLAEEIVYTVRDARGRGRPRSSLRLDPAAASAITISLTIDRLHVRRIDYAGEELGRLERTLDTRALSAAELVEEVGAAIEACRDAASPERAARRRAGPVRHVALGFQGVTGHATGSLSWSPILSVSDVPVRAELERRLGVPVTVENDCRCIARALHAAERERLGASFATVLFSHGVGLGIYIDDEAFAGARTSALELGHLRHRRDGARCRCGNLGCIEAYAADYAIVRAVEGDPDDAPSGRLTPERFAGLVERAGDGDARRRAALHAAGAAIGDGLGQLFTLLDAMPVALAGRSAAGIEAMRPGIEAALAACGGPWSGAAPVELHGFSDEEPLLQRGLALDALAALDARLAIAHGRRPPAGGTAPGGGASPPAERGTRRPPAPRSRSRSALSSLVLGCCGAIAIGGGSGVQAQAQAQGGVQVEANDPPPPWSDRASVFDASDAVPAPPAGTLDARALAAMTARGERLFTHRFTSADGVGRPMATQAIVPTKRKRAPRSEFSRTAGLDANACASCHHDPVSGGAGDFSVNVFVSEGFEHTDFDTTDPQFSNERNTNHLFGAGLVELLAREMTAELQAQRAAGLERAHASGEATRVALEAKGVRFGELGIAPDGRVDTRELHGLDQDLVIRPFSRKGVMTSLRQFTVNALNHHHGIQGGERFAARWTGEADHDGDGKALEIADLDVSALVAWQATLSPPGRRALDAPGDDAWRRAAVRGEAEFESIGCGECHRSSLPLDSLAFDDPGPLDAAGTLRTGEVPELQYTYDLGSLEWAKALPRDAAGRVLVPLFGDLKRHVISDRQVAVLGNERLSQRFVERDEFMTAELWGVGSTAPYGHRGDLGTLSEVIDAHGGEARASRDAWRALEDAGRDDIVAWLKTFVIVP